MPQFKGSVEIQDGEGSTTILLDGDTGDTSVGGGGQHGRVVVGTGAGGQRVILDGETGTVTIHAADGDPLVTLDGQTGDIVVQRKVAGTTREVLRLDAGSAALTLGANGIGGDLVVRDGAGRDVLTFAAANAALFLGADGNEGDLIVRDASNREVFHFDAQNAVLRLGTTGNEGDLIVRDAENREVFHFDSNFAVLRIGTTGNEGDLIVRDAENREVFHFDSNFAVLRLGATGNEGDLIVRNDRGAETIHLDGNAGDIILRNADAAEDFELAPEVAPRPGTVMVLDGDGRLRPCSSAYDRKVVGVIAGAGSCRPGIVLNRRAEAGAPRAPISIVGRAACHADARYGAIGVGDLLTSSPTAGCAMRASDAEQAFGAIIGKALTPLPAGSGLVEMVIGLQ
jgi:hypothetical protein